MPAPRTARAYLSVVALAGLGALVAGLADPGSAVRSGAPLTVAVLAVLLVVSELFPVRVGGRNASDCVSVSGAFTCALLLLPAPWVLVALVQVAASLLDDARARTSPLKSAFNAGQYTLAVAGAALVLRLVGDAGPPALAELACCAAFFLLNTVLTGVAVALFDGDPVGRSLRTDLPAQAWVGGVVVALGPVVATVSRADLALVALLLAPILAVHRGAVTAAERDHVLLHDRLTGLPNQVAFAVRLEEQVRESEQDATHVAVLVLSLDHFDDVSHTLGHVAGDDLLRAAGERLAEHAPAGAAMARLDTGGFLLSLPGLASPWHADAVAEGLHERLAEPFPVLGTSFTLTASIGVTVAPLHGTDPARLVQLAEVARDVARRTHSGIEVYSPQRDDFTARRLAVLAGLTGALQRREMTVHFQPQVDLASGTVTGHEALLRWEHPDLGPVSPDEFVPLAEQAGMMGRITDHVLDEALRRASEWRTCGSAATVSVNVSASVLQDRDLPHRVARRLALWGVPSSALVLELTETAVMSQPERCHDVMRELRSLQVALSLDDYGTGYASLAYLTTLPVDEIKIDKSFVLGMTGSRPDRLVVRSTLDLARELGLRVVAEGVETAEVADLLVSYGCRTAQGYLYGHAVPPAELLGVPRPTPLPS